MIAALLPVISFGYGTVAHASENLDYFRLTPTQVVYSRIQPTASSIKGMRSYVWDIVIGDFGDADLVAEYPGDRTKNDLWSNLAVQDLTRAFRVIASTVLASSTDTPVVMDRPLPRDPRKNLVWGFPELESTSAVCRGHRKKASLVLPRPYLEDTEYCLRLILDPRTEAPRKALRLQAEASVTLTKDPRSAYREPSRKEIVPFEELLAKLLRDVRVELQKSAMDEGWRVTESRSNTFEIQPLASIRGEEPDFSFRGPGQITYARTWDGRCPPKAICGAPIRAYISDVYIEIPDVDLADRAARELTSSFGGIASEVLASKADTIALGWQDLEDTVCRVHQGKPSMVLPAPYYENVEYCVRIIPAGPPDARFRNFRLQADAKVTVALNPESGYREPASEQEITPFKELLVEFGTEIRIRLEKISESEGWHVADHGFNTFEIDGLLSKR